MAIKKTIHTYLNNNPIQIINKNNKVVIIERNDLIEFLPKFNIKKEISYTILHKKKNEEKVMDISFEIAKKIDENSMKQLFIKNDNFEVDKEQEIIERLYETISLYLDNLKTQLENKDIASNFLEINNYVGNIIVEIKKVKTNEDNTKINLLECQKTIDYFNYPTELNIDKSNVNRESYHQYIKKLEKYAFEFLIDAINKDKTNYNKSIDDDLNTIQYTLLDFTDILKIAYCLNEDNVYDAAQASNLDTYIRDGFDEDFYQNWYCVRDSDMLKKQQESNQQRKQLEKELPIKPNEKTKVKI